MRRGRHRWTDTGRLAAWTALALVTACGGLKPAAPSAPATATSTPVSRADAPASAVEWMVLRKEYVRSTNRYRLTVSLRGAEKTYDASRVCYEVAVPGQPLPETILSPLGYDVVCRVEG